MSLDTVNFSFLSRPNNDTMWVDQVNFEDNNTPRCLCCEHSKAHSSNNKLGIFSTYLNLKNTTFGFFDEIKF